MKMRTDIRIGVYRRAVSIAVVAIAIISVLISQAWAMPKGPHHAFLTGPWELVVQMGMEGQDLHFPVVVSDENKPEELNSVLPVMGTPITIRPQQYLPDLKWETTEVKHADGGIVAKLTIRGEGLNQDMWLNSADPARQSISSSIGGIEIKRLHDPNTVKKIVHMPLDPNIVGVMTVWPQNSNSPLEYVARVGETLVMPQSKYKLSFLEYVPHYLVDAKTKKVVSRSNKPVNPAIKVRVDDGENTYEQWLWAKFPSSPHKELKLPLRMKFADFNLSGTDGQYILVAARGSEPWLLFSHKGKSRAEKALLGRPYLFMNEAYSFSIEKIMDNAILKTDWKNGSESLRHPAIIAKVEYDDTVLQTVLEFNKPYHQKTKYGTMVLIYRRRPVSFKSG